LKFRLDDKGDRVEFISFHKFSSSSFSYFVSQGNNEVLQKRRVEWSYGEIWENR
jgi:hypothetical protein